MTAQKRLIALVMVVGAALLAGCSKTVTWEEEVPLNTGETIWVKREVVYRLKGAGGNPFDMGYRPDWTEQLSFEWKGQPYRYVGDADLMLLAISPDKKRPVLAARADLKNWDTKNRYRCTTPFYVQLMPSGTGRDWPWLFDMPSNLMLHRSEIGEVKKRYSAIDRAEADRVVRNQSPSLTRIDPLFRFDQCNK
jgi:hypothetical protein